MKKTPIAIGWLAGLWILASFYCPGSAVAKIAARDGQRIGPLFDMIVYFS